MLTYRTGAAGAASAARAMGEHLLQQTLTPEMAVMAEYYAQGMSPPTPAEAAAARYGHEATRGRLPGGVLLDPILEREIDRLEETAAPSVSHDALAVRAIGAFLAAGLIDRSEAEAAFVRRGQSVDGESADAAIAAGRAEKDYSSATAAPRRDMNPVLANKLGIELTRGLTSAEVANLLSGQRADGADIPGKQKQAATEAIGVLFGMKEGRLPMPDELEHVLAGRTVDGSPLEPKVAERAVRRFQSALGVKGAMTDTQRAEILAGRTASGGELTPEQYHERMDTSRSRIGYVDLTFSAPKSVSVAWAFAPTEAERGMIHQAHRDAIDSVMQHIEQTLGRARKGQGGKDGWEPGSIGWVSFDHYSARPTVEVVREDEAGCPYTELHTLRGPSGRVAGDMQLHTHTAVMNAVLTESGRMGGLDLAQLEGRVHEWGALYQAYLATNLRRHGVDVVLDERTDLARLAAVPERITEHFSKRTVGGTAAARAYAAEQGLDWDSLEPGRKIGLIKQGVQDPRGAKSDDLSDMQAWQRAASEIGYRHRSILRPDEIQPEIARETRLERAYQAALHVFDKALQRRASVEGADARVAAAKGLIAAGVESPADVNAVTAAMRERGVKQHGRHTGLIWGQVKNAAGREKVGITTALHAAEERELVVMAKAAGADCSAALTPKQIREAVKQFPEIDFDTEHGKAQRAVMDQLGTGGRLAVAIGVAGSGKSTLLKPLVEAWKRDGRSVHGIALAWRQADDLAEAGITTRQTRAVESFLRSVEKGKTTLDKQSVVVIDELGLLGTRQLNDLLRAQKAHGFQIVGIGDPKQMQSVEAGGVIELLQRGLGPKAVPTLESSVRQIGEDERETTLMFRNGETAEAVARKHANGTLRIVPGGYEENVQAVVALWQERRDANVGRDRYSLSISAPTNQDAHQLSVAIRERRRALGEVGADLRVVQATAPADGARTYDLALAAGDKVRLFERTNARFLDTNTGGNIGRNGTVLEVADVRPDGLVLRTKEGRDGLVKWDSLTSKANGRTMLAYGDVLTTNTSQGATVSEHIFALPAGSRGVTAFGAYTSGSRHREQSYVVTSDGAERGEVAGRRPLGDKREIRESDVVGNIVRNFARQPVKESALALIDRAENVRAGTVRRLQQGKQGLEQREVDGKGRSTLAEAFARRRDEKAAAEAAEKIGERMREQRDLLRRMRDFGAKVHETLRAAIYSRMDRRDTEKAKQEVTRRRGPRL